MIIIVIFMIVMVMMFKLAQPQQNFISIRSEQIFCLCYRYLVIIMIVMVNQNFIFITDKHRWLAIITIILF